MPAELPGDVIRLGHRVVVHSGQKHDVMPAEGEVQTAPDLVLPVVAGSEADSERSKVEVNFSRTTSDEITETNENEATTEEVKEPSSTPKQAREMTRKELFEELYLLRTNVETGKN